MCLFFRILIEVIYIDIKPIVIVLTYTLAIYIISFKLLLSAEVLEVKRKISLLGFLFLSLIMSLIYSEVAAIDYVKNTLQIFTPCIFLVASTSNPLVMKRAAQIFFKYLFVPSLTLLCIKVYWMYATSRGGESSILDFYLNNPHHGMAQTILKLVLFQCGSGMLWLVLPGALMFLINVRSVILSYAFATFYVHRKSILSKHNMQRFLLIGIPIAFVILAYVDWMEVYTRLVLKGREGDIASTASSGRTIIYAFYISYMITEFSIFEWFFGVGPIWLGENGPILSAHNDILNSLVSFGFSGLILLIIAYGQFYKSLPLNVRGLFLIPFSILFLTNGVLFHQSNILFVLLYYHYKESLGVGVVKYDLRLTPAEYFVK